MPDERPTPRNPPAERERASEPRPDDRRPDDDTRVALISWDAPLVPESF